jgi:hypothetical protein
MGRAYQTKQFFSIDTEYDDCYGALIRTGILMTLPKSKSIGIIGIDGNEYPIPTKEQVEFLFDQNKELISKKVPQGFDRLVLVPLAMHLTLLLENLQMAIIKHSTERKIFQTRNSASDLLKPVRVNTEKQVWMWETLKQKIDSEAIVYFPQEYSDNHNGYTKLETIKNESICAIPGWTVGLVESLPFMPQQGRGKILGGRRQLEIGSSPHEYLHTLRTDSYHRETGKTLEDFITEFLIHLETTDEVSNDRTDNNSLWCLGQYTKTKYAELVPTAWWHREFGRLRLDMHRTGNKLCTRSWGAATMVRLVRY